MSEVAGASPLLQSLYRARADQEMHNEMEDCEASLAYFISKAWPSLKPMEAYVHNWHIDAACEKLEAVSAGEITRLQIWVPPGTMKPVDVEALVLMEDGSRKRLGDVGVGDYVITHRGRGARVEAVHDQGLLPTLEITTDSNRVVRAAADHPFLTPDGWKRADALREGEALGVIVNPNERIQSDRIVSILASGRCECRCLTVERDHSFTANDIVVKNTLIVSVFWPAWEWIKNPWLRYWGASYEVRLAGRMAAMSRDLMMGHWYQERWGDQFKFSREGENYFGNDMGGTRLATAPQSTGSGEHGHRIMIDDPINAKSADATSKVTLNETNEWYDSTVVTRGIGIKHARVIIMQRLHESDLAAHVLEKDEWDVLCLPERYEPSHPFVWPNDPRDAEGELLWPEHRDEKASNSLAASLTPHRAAGQLQQRPSAKEGDILKVEWWRFYDPRIRSKEQWSELPAFSMVVMSLDCPLKDKESNDNVAIQTWGIHGLQRYLLDVRLGKMSYPNAKRATLEMARWARATWPRARHKVLIENAGYGSDLILDLKAELTGITKVNPQQDGSKEVRADAASDFLEDGNCFLPGYGPPWRPPVYDASNTPADVAGFIANAARFPNVTHDDDIDAWSQLINWMRGKDTKPVRTSSATKGRSSGRTSSTQTRSAVPGRGRR